MGVLQQHFHNVVASRVANNTQKKKFKKNFKKLTSYLLSACKNIFKKKT